MFVVWDKMTNRPLSKKYGHFTVYATKQAAQRMQRNWKHRTEVREVSHLAFTAGDFY